MPDPGSAALVAARGLRQGASTVRAVLPLLLFAVACRSLPAEPKNAVRVARTWGVATAERAEDARELADRVEAARPFLAALPGFEDRPLRIHVFPGTLPLHWSGMTVHDDRGDAWIAVERPSEYFSVVVVHELVHFYLHEILQRLPPVVAEGFCEVFALQHCPTPEYKTQRILVAAVSYLDRFVLEIEGPGARARLPYLVQDVPPIAVALEADADDLPLLSQRISEAYYGIGCVVADALGVEGLAALEARRAEAGLETIPVSWILREAGLEPLTQDNLRVAIARTIGQPRAAAGTLTITLGDP